MACSSGCPTPGLHDSFGACLRAKNLEIDRHSLKGHNELEKRKDHTLARFRECVKAGVIPPSPLKSDVEKAERVANAK